MSCFALLGRHVALWERGVRGHIRWVSFCLTSSLLGEEVRGVFEFDAFFFFFVFTFLFIVFDSLFPSSSSSFLC